MADYTTNLSVKLDDQVSPAAGAATASLGKLSTQSESTGSALLRYNEAMRQWGIQGAENLGKAALIEGSLVALAAGYGVAKASQAAWNAGTQDTANMYDTITAKASALRQATDNGTLALSDFGGVLRSFGLNAAATAFDWVNAWSSGVDTFKSKTADLQTQLRATREDFALVADAATKAAQDAVLQGPVSKTDAMAAARTFVADANFNTAALSLTAYIKSSTDLATVMNITVPEAAKKLVSAIDDTAAAAKNAQSQGLVGFNSGLVEQIALMQSSGDRMGALSLYMRTLGKDIDDAAKPLDPFTQAMRGFYAMLDSHNGPGLFDSFFKSIHDALESIAAFVIQKVTAIVGAFLTARDTLTNYITGGSGAPPTPTSANAAIIPTANSNLSSANQRLIANTTDLVLPRIGLNADADALAAVQKLASRIIPLESSGNQFDPKNPSQVLTSPAGAMGLMQVMPAVAGQYNQDPASAQGNVNAGVQLLYDLYQKYGGDIVKVAIAYNWGQGNADKFFLGEAKIPQETVKFATAATGLTPAQFQERYQSQMAGSAFADKVNTDASTLAGGGSSLDQQKAANLAQQQLLNTALANARNDLSVATNSGDNDGISNAISRIATLNEALAKAKGAATGLISETAKFADTAAKAADLSALTGVDKTIAAIRQKYEAAAKSSGQPFDQANFDSEVASKQIELANAAAQKQTELQKAYTDATDAIVTQNDRQKTLTDTYAVSTQATAFATNAIKAQTEADKAYDADDDKRIAAIQARTAALNQETLQKNDNAAAGDVKSFALSNELLQKQIDLLGGSTQAQNEEIAALQERHKWGLTANDDLSEWQQKAVDAAKANADLKTSFDTQKNSLADLSNIFTKSFDTIGNAITSAFLSGQGAAVNFGTVIKAVVSQILKDIAQLAVINPIINALFNTNKTTLDGALSAVGAGGGQTTSSSSSGGFGLSSLFSLGSTASSVSGAFGGPTIMGTVGNYLGLTGAGGSLFGAGGVLYGGMSASTALAASTPLAAGVSGPVAVGATAGEGATTLGALATPALSIGGGALAGFAAGSLVGGAVQSGLNKTGPAPEIGAGVGGIAGAIAGQILIPIPVVGALIGGLIGGAIGGAGGGFIGPHTKTTYSSTQLFTNDQGQLQAGATNAQGYNATADVAALSQQMDAVNSRLAANDIKISQRFLQIGINNPGGYQQPDKYRNLDAAIGGYSFTASDPNLQSHLQGKSFGSVQEFTALIDAFDHAQAAAKSYLTDTTTLLATYNKTSGTFTDSINSINASFDKSIANGDALIATGYLSASQTASLAAAEVTLNQARADAIKLVEDQTNLKVADTNVALHVRYDTAKASLDNNPGEGVAAQLEAFDQSANDQRAQLKATFVGLFGDAYLATSGYANESALLEVTLGEERLKIQSDYNTRIAAADQQAKVADTNVGLHVRYDTAKASLDNNPAEGVAAQLEAFDQSAVDQRAQLKATFVGLFGDAYLATSGYANESALLEVTLGEERLKIQNDYNTQIAAADKQAKDHAAQSASGTVVSLAAYVAGLGTGSTSPLSPQAQLAFNRTTFANDALKSKSGDYAATQALQTDSTNLLNASKAVFGTGTGYTSDFKQVLDTLTTVANLGPDALTQSAFVSETKTQTATLVTSLADLSTKLTAIKLQLQQNATTPTQLAA